MNSHRHKIPFIQSLRGRLVILLTVLALVPFFLMVPVPIYLFISQIDNVRKERGNEVNLQVQNLTQWVQARKGEMSLAANLPEIQNMKASDATAMIKLLAKQWPYYQNIFVALPDGSRVFDSIGGATSLAGYDYFTRAMQGETVMSNVALSRTTGKATVVFVAPIKSGEKVVGVMGSEISTDFLQQLMQQMRFGNSGDAYLVNTSGMFMTEARFTEELKQSGQILVRTAMELTNKSIGVERALQGQSGTANFSVSGDFTDYRGHHTLGIYQRIDELGWVMVVEQDYDETFSQLNLMLIATSIGMILILGLLTVLVYFFSGTIAKPVQLIADEARRLSLGDISPSAELQRLEQARSRHDEIGVVGQAFFEMTSYLQEAVQAARSIAAGSLRTQVNIKSEKDQLGIALTQMINNLRSIVGEMGESAAQLGSTSEEMTVGASEASQAVMDIFKTMSQATLDTQGQVEALDQSNMSVKEMGQSIVGLAQGAQEQATAASAASNITVNINRAIDQVTHNINAASQGSQNAASAARIGVETVAKTVQGMQNIKEKVDLSAQSVQEMGKHSSQIGSIVETIADIASQTNLLALNAAIEAARAGEHGKGFAVVADEVRKLAERSSNATKEIGGLVRSIQLSVEEAIEAMEVGANEVELGVSRAGEAGKALQDILTAAEAVRQQTEQAAREAVNMHISADELVNAMESVSAVIEQNTASTEEMSANSAEVEQSIERITSLSHANSQSIVQASTSAQKANTQVEAMVISMENLAQMAEALRSTAARFEI
jgi:methyl-accepting chemotaxis protein